ncbi:hypothetical protein K438DRAFT_1953684 [Mycena galopus ATCC 62051]|nr:hypothetical protein K438DRAFT_1953684 [Mycena galopus ATCC 62051]
MHYSVLCGRRTHPDTEHVDVGGASNELLPNGSGNKTLGCTLAPCVVGGPIPTPSTSTLVAPATSYCQMATETNSRMHYSVLCGRRTYPDTEHVDVGGASNELLPNGSGDQNDSSMHSSVLCSWRTHPDTEHVDVAVVSVTYHPSSKGFNDLEEVV